MECPECIRLARLLLEAETERAELSAKAGKALQPVNMENTADLGSTLRLALSVEAVNGLKTNLAQHEASHNGN